MSLFGVRRTKDSSSLIIIRNRLRITVIGWNFAGAGGVGKKARNTRSKLHVANFFVTEVTGVLWEGVRAVLLALDWSAAAGAPWWSWGGRSSIHVGSHRKAYQVRNDFFIFVVPELYLAAISLGTRNKSSKDWQA